MIRRAWVLFVLLLPAPAWCCSFCETLVKRDSLAQEYARADVVVYGRLANPRLDGVRPGSGTTELLIETVVKAAPHWQAVKSVTIPQYVPLLDAKEPPRSVLFFRLDKSGLTLRSGRQVTSPAVLEYLKGWQTVAEGQAAQKLAYAARYLDHTDPALADDAFMEFARADDRDIAQAAQQLAPERLRKLLAQRDLDPRQLSMFAYLLGVCGNDADAALLRGLLQQPGMYKSLEGVLAGYIQLRPAEGWQSCLALLGNPKEAFVARIGAVRTLRFLYNAGTEESRAKVMQGMALLIPQGDLADFAINDLCAWKRWDHTALILAQWGKPSHQAPIARRSIVRYALTCPLPEARRFVEVMRRQDAELVQELEDDARLAANP